MGSGPKVTTTKQEEVTQRNQSQSAGQQTGESQFSNTTTPNLPDWFLPFKQALSGGYGQLLQQSQQAASSPLYGPQQQAAFQQQLNQGLGQSRQQILSQLAKSGALGSGRAAQVQTQLELGGLGKMQDYLSQVPLLNAQYKTGALGQWGSALGGASALSLPYGQTQTGNSMFNNLQNESGNSFGNSVTNGTQTQQQSGGLLNSLLGGLINAGLGALTGGISSAIGGMGGGGKANPGWSNY